MENMLQETDSKASLGEIKSLSDIECMQDFYKDHRDSVPVVLQDGHCENLYQEIQKEKINLEEKVKKQRRKLRSPARGPARFDPNFRGVSFCLQTYLDGEDSHLMISAHFSNVKAGFERMFRNHNNSVSGSSPCWTASDDENIPTFVKEPYFSAKTCASCRTKRTPLWRDAEDGTPLCNACGIRFKKYRVRCGRCWHIPRKEIKTFPNCPSCGYSLRMSVPRRNW